MNVSTFLANARFSFSRKSNTIDKPDDLTSIDLYKIVALDTQDGFVRLSMETWKRVELFIGILSTVNCACCEADINVLLTKYREAFNDLSNAAAPTQAAPGAVVHHAEK
jgi:hypothetical protein